MSSTRRACDACHRRKIRCEGKKPCKQCLPLSLICTFDAIPQRKGPKGPKARVISGIREEQQHATLAEVHSLSPFAPPTAGRVNRLSLRPPWAPTPGLLSPDLVAGCTDFFFAHLYPTMPILQRQRFHAQHVVTMDASLESYCLVGSLCAFMMIQPGMELADMARSDAPLPPNGLAAGRTMVDEVLRVRKGFDYVASPSVATVMTSFFLFACYFGLDQHKTAWFYLRESTTCAQMLDMHDENTYHSGDVVECIRRRRLFWLLFVTERAYALQRHHPLTLGDTIGMSTVDEDPSEKMELSGFIHLVNLFKPFDEVFVGLWNKTRSDCSTLWLAQLQSRLANALPLNLDSTESQAADLLTSQQWLRTMVWQLSITNGYLSSTATDTSMTFQFPVKIARDLVSVTSRLSQQSMEVHGIGLIEKLFDVACTLSDVMVCVPMESSALEVGPRDYLNHFLTTMSTLRGGQSRFVPPLLEKIEDMVSTMSGPVIPLITFHPDPHPHNPDGRVEELDLEASSWSGSSSRLFTPPSLSVESSMWTETSGGSRSRSSSFNDDAPPAMLDPSSAAFLAGFSKPSGRSRSRSRSRTSSFNDDAMSMGLGLDLDTADRFSDDATLMVGLDHNPAAAFAGAHLNEVEMVFQG
ncbi:MAG: hypothetical protein M1826_002501 [Phylliscum demangeonii]|nr:MAG: hypothetical protein M1826_002501 [Phylliscum demangeonii]